MKKILLFIFIFQSFLFPNDSQADTGQCTVNLTNIITLTQTKQRITYAPVSCSNLPSGAEITDIQFNWQACNILYSGDIEVRLSTGNAQLDSQSVVTEPPEAPVCRGNNSGNTPITEFNGLSAESTFEVSMIFDDGAAFAHPLNPDITLDIYDLTIDYEYSPPVMPPPTADFTFSTDDLVASFQNTTSGGEGSVSYSWDFGDGSSSVVSSPTHIYSTSGTYSVQLTATDSIGQTDTITKSVSPTEPTPVLDLDVAPLSYEYGNCNGYSRNGIVYWEAAGDATSYEFEEKIGNAYTLIYSGTNPGLSYSKSAYVNKYYKIRARGVAGTEVGDWVSRQIYVPKCGAGGPPPQ